MKSWTIEDVCNTRQKTINLNIYQKENITSQGVHSRLQTKLESTTPLFYFLGHGRVQYERSW